MTDVDDKEPGLRERKKRETRAALSLAATRLCVKHGWDNVTVDDIAAAANVSPRTLRNYFSNKAEAVAAGHLERLLRIADRLRARPADEELWTAIIHSVMAEFEPQPQKDGKAPDAVRWAERIRFIVTEPAIHGEVLKASAVAEEELAKAIAARTAMSTDRDMYPQLVAAAVGAGIGVVMWRWLHSGPVGSIVPLLHEMFDQIRAGLPAPAQTRKRSQR